MPARTRSRADRYRLGLDGQEIIITEEKFLVSRYLQSQYLCMLRELKRDVTCPICMWNPSEESIEKRREVLHRYQKQNKLKIYCAQN